MFNFNLKRTEVYYLLKLKKWVIFRFVGFLKGIFFILLILSFLFLFFKFFSFYFSLGIFLVILSFFLFFNYSELFLNSRIKNFKPIIKGDLSSLENYNSASLLGFNIAKPILEAINFSRKRHFLVDSTILFYFILKNNSDLNFIFSRSLINLKELREILKKEISNIKINNSKDIFSLDFQNLILNSFNKENQRIDLEDVLINLPLVNPLFKNILFDVGLNQEDFKDLVLWQKDLKITILENKKFWEIKNLFKKGSLAKDWAAGYTVLLDKFSIDITKAMRKQKFRKIFAHADEIEEMELILARVEKNNVLIVGDSGSARKSMIEFLANKCALGESLTELNHKRIVLLDMLKILTFVKDIEEAEKILDEIFQEVLFAENIILVIDDIHNYIESGPDRRAGVLDISAIISSYLSAPSFRFIGITDFEGFQLNIERKLSILNLFEKIEVSEISEKEALEILKDRSISLSIKYKVIIPYISLKNIISLTAKHMPALSFPEKAMGLIDEAVVLAVKNRTRIILPKDIAKLITNKTKIPVGEVDEKEKETLLNLENLIHQRIINQEEAVKEISTALRRSKSEVTIKKGLMGSFLFLGPTGVGKTETSKALSEIYFGSEEKMIRLDMSEFQSIKDISRLIGGSEGQGLLTTKIKENPFSLILLDEIEKAHPDILNLFLQVLDEGHITDGMGRKVYFKNSIIIATSNAGYEIILHSLKNKVEWSSVKQKLLDFIFEKGIFRPEFINRFDGVIVFSPLSKENLLLIAGLLLEKIKKNLLKKEIEFIITDSLKEKIAEIGYNPIFGARQMQRVIQDKVENILATELLSGKITRGSKVEINPIDFSLIIN